MGLSVIEKVCLVKKNDDRDTICLSRSQETVNKDRRRLGIVNGEKQQYEVNISGKDVALLGQVGSAADDVIPPVGYLTDKSSAVVVFYQVNDVPHSNRIGAAYSPKPEITLNLTLQHPAAVSTDLIPTAGVPDNETLH